MPLYEAVLDSIHAVTDGVAPMLLVLEDLHWADASTRDLLRFVLPGCPTSGCSSSGPTAPTTCTAVTRSARCWRSSSGCPGSSASRSSPSTPRAPRLPQHAHGSQLPEASSRTSWAARRATPTTPRSSSRPPTTRLAGHRRRVALPEQLADVLLARLERLLPASSRSPGSLRRRTTGVRTRCSAPPAACRPSRSRRPARGGAHHVLVPDGDDRYAFRHALLQEAIYGDLLPGERVRLHSTYARLLAEQGDGASAADLARHCMAALDLRRARGVRPGARRRPSRPGAGGGLPTTTRRSALGGGARGRAPAGPGRRRLTVRAASAAGSAGELDRRSPSPPRPSRWPPPVAIG